MLSLKNAPSAVKLCDCFIDGKPAAVYFHQKQDKALRNEVEDVTPILRQPSFREKYDLSRGDIAILSAALNSDQIPEEDDKIRKKYFSVKRAINNLSLTEMSFEDQDNSRFEVNLPEKRSTWAAGIEVAGNSGSGKSYWTQSLLLRNWKGKLNHRRPVLWWSTEEQLDKTLVDLKKKRFSKLYTGVDVGEEAFREWSEANQDGSLEKFWKTVVKPTLKKLPRSGILVCDDFEDSVVWRLKDGSGIQQTLESMLRTGRHSNRSTISLLHRITSGWMGRQISNSVRLRVMFPRSSRHKIQLWLRDKMGLQMSYAKELVQRIAAHSRWMAVHMFSPVAIISEHYVVLL
jgi:hypothetical protein